ncbi:MAG: hypothetical protein EP317_04590 [Bacillota bacterium]|nr:MAG: hypothetical protein EP317_04590 [Bacillota bacterium]
MAIKNKTQNKRDIILVLVLLVVVGSVFAYFNYFAYGNDAAVAHIYYGNSDEPIASIDFDKQVVTHRKQEVPGDYDDVFPIIDSNNRTITLLGDYKVDGRRQIVVIQYNFGQRSVKIIEESSPNNICSLEGTSTGKPLICLPNRIRVEFEREYDESIPDFVV